MNECHRFHLHDELKDAQEFATWVLVNYQMLSTLVSFVVLVWLRPISSSVTARAAAWSARHFEEMAFVLERVHCSALETNRKWYAYSDKFSCSQVVTGFTKELRRVEVENSNRVPRSRRIFALKFLYVFLLGSFRRRAQDPQVGNSYRVPRWRWIFALNFLCVFLLRILQAARPRSSGRELVPCNSTCLRAKDLCVCKCEHISDTAGSFQAGRDQISDPAGNFGDMLSPNSRGQPK